MVGVQSANKQRQERRINCKSIYIFLAYVRTLAKRYTYSVCSSPRAVHDYSSFSLTLSPVRLAFFVESFLDLFLPMPLLLLLLPTTLNIAGNQIIKNGNFVGRIVDDSHRVNLMSVNVIFAIAHDFVVASIYICVHSSDWALFGPPKCIEFRQCDRNTLYQHNALVSGCHRWRHLRRF